MGLNEDIYFGDYKGKLQELANLSPEQWSFTNKSDYSILKNYLVHTYSKLEEENKITTTDKYRIFNTGLYTEYYESIYVYLEPNTAGGEQPWYLKAFYQEYDLGNLGIIELPERANYFQDPSLLVFDATCKINVQYKHIFSDTANIERLPKDLQDNPMLPVLFEGALERMKKMVIANYKIAVPQYYKSKIQLLLPIYLTSNLNPDIVLVVTKSPNGHFYQGHTCLTLEMAYNNARLIAKPESHWLKP